MAGSKKRYRYAAIGKGEEELSDKMRSLFQACIESIQTVGNIVVIKTLNGNGANAGVIIDMLKYAEIVGSIAGDDTVFSLCKTAEDAETVRARLERLAGN